jgi:hypothetical protein
MRSSTAKGHINSHEEVRAPRLWICGGYSQDEFQAFKHQWSLFRGYHSGMEDMELRYQLLDSINGPLEDAMYDAFGDETYTIPDNRMLEELEKFAVKEIIKHVKYPTKISEKNPVKLPPAHRSTAHSSPAHSSLALSKSKRIAAKQPPAYRSPAHSNPAHSSQALSKSKKIAVKQTPAHSSPTKQPPTTSRPQPLHKHWLHWGFLVRTHMDLLPGEVPRRSTSTQYRQEDQHQDLASEDQYKNWHQKTAPPP